MCACLYPTSEIAGATWIGEYFGRRCSSTASSGARRSPPQRRLGGANALPPDPRPAL